MRLLEFLEDLRLKVVVVLTLLGSFMSIAALIMKHGWELLSVTVLLALVLLRMMRSFLLTNTSWEAIQ